MSIGSQRAFGTTNLSLLALTYWFYFGQLGVLVPYLGVFLDGRGFTSEQIGELFAIITLARILGPNLWATLADKTGRSLAVMQLGCFLTFGCFSLIFWVEGFWGITLSFALMMMFWTAVLPQMEVITLNSVKGHSGRYSKIRLWGSIGFVVLTVLVGKLLDLYSSEAPIYVSAFVLFALFAVSMLLVAPPSKKPTKDASGSMWKHIRHPTFVIFIISAILLQVSFGAYYGFFALYMRDLGFAGQQIGLLIALGVVAEVFIFMMAGRLIEFFGVKWILFISIMLTAFRWLALAIWPQHTWLIVLVQCLHAFSFGMTHSASVHFIHGFFEPRFQSRGQAIYISVAFGFGGAIGNYMAGQLWQQGLGAQLAFSVAAGAAAAGAVALLVPHSKAHPSFS